MEIGSVEVVGVGLHDFGRFPHRSLKDLARQATISALADAGLEVRDVQAAYSSNSLAGLLSGQAQIRGQTVLRDIGIEGIPIVNVENACAGGSTAFREAALAIEAGAADVVLAVGFEKMYVEDRTRTLQALRSAADLDVVSGLGLQFTAVYAMRLRQRLDDGSLTMSDLVESAVKSHRHGALNPHAQYQQEVTAEQVTGSRLIADPLTLLMCSSISDGAAAVVLARRGSPAADRADHVILRASAIGSGRTNPDVPVSQRVANQTYEAAGVGPHDLDVLEVHDAMSPGELLYYEQLGLCDYGEAGRLLHDGDTSLGGPHVVNPSGGLSSRGHPVGATGLAQIVELTWQLRGTAGARQVEGARLALAQNSGGWLEGDSAVGSVNILERLQQ